MSEGQRKIAAPDRLCLIQALNALPAAQFEAIIFALRPPSGIIPGSAAPQGSRSAALLEWAESPTGPGLTELERILERVAIQAQATPSSPTSQAIRTKLLRRLQRDINIRLENSLHKLVKIDLQLEDQRQHVGQSNFELVPEDDSGSISGPNHSFSNRVLQPLGAQKEAASKLEPTQSLLPVLKRNDIQGRLLILGEPGAGKTTELVALAYDLLAQAIHEGGPIPIIFELSTWQEETPVEQWIIAQIKQVYKISESIIQQWLHNEEILPLLDGLDELGLVNQRKCIEAINQFLQNQGSLNIVVCCRREEYEAGQAVLNQLNGATYLQPLTNEQIQDYLRDLNRLSLWTGIQKNRELLALARQPLFLTMLVIAYQGQPIKNESELFDAYIDKQLKEPNSQGVYPPGKSPNQQETLNCLSWLAKQLEDLGETEFLIEAMQPSWLSRPNQSLYRLMLGVITGTIIGVVLGIGFGSNTANDKQLLNGLFFGLSTGLIFGLTFGLSGSLNSSIQSAEEITWSPKKGVSGGLLTGLIGGLGTGIGLGWLTGLNFGLSVGLSFGIIFGLIGGAGFGLKSISVEEKNFPNQGIRKSLKNSVVITILLGLGGGLIVGISSGIIYGLAYNSSVGLSFGLNFGLSFGLALGLVGALASGLKTVLQHYTLRFLLAREGSFPWDCVRFLDHAAQHRFVQRVGGRYRFMHDLMRKHFAYSLPISDSFR